jgi:Icc-related predicted phosphoesterase
VQVLRYLLELGHRRIGIVSSAIRPFGIEERLRGAKQTLVVNGLALDQQLIGSGDFSVESGERVGHMMLAHPQDTRFIDALADQLAQADLVLLVGDIANASGARGAAEMVQAVRRHNSHVLAIPGNWDDPGACSYLTDEGINLDRRHVVVEQIAFAGVGGSLPSIAHTPNELTEAELAQALADAITNLDPQLPLVLLCHQPPAQTCNDRTWSQMHAGSTAVRAFLERAQPLVCFTGHIHEGIGIDTIGRTQIVNPGPLWKGGYAYAEVTPQGAYVECRQLAGVRTG